MEVFQKMVVTQALMFIYLLIGAIMSKTGILKKEARSSFLGVLINVTVPCMILHSFEMHIEGDAVSLAVQAFVAAVLCSVGGWAVGWLLFHKKEPGRRKALIFTSMLTNMGSIGLPVVSSVFGALGVFLTSFELITNVVFCWSFGLALYVKCEPGQLWKKVLTNPNVIAIGIGVVVFLTPMEIPAFVSNALNSIGGMTAPLSMMIIGATLSDMKPRELLDKDALLLSFVRLIALPLGFMAVMRLLGVPDIIWQVTTVLFAMPAASNSAIIAEMYNDDYPFATKCVFVSTVLALVTIPCLTLLF